MRGLGTAALVLLAWALAARAGDTAWTAPRGDPANTAACRWDAGADPPQIREWTFTGRPGRRYQPGVTVWASPALAVVNGRPMAFIGGFDQTLHALDLIAKEERWAKITNGAIAESPAVGAVDGRAVVFWGSADRTVYAYQADSGGEGGGVRLWSRELVAATSTSASAELSAPLLHAGVLYISCFAYDRALSRSDQKGWLIALDMSTGRELWRHEVSHGPLSSPTGCLLDGRFTVFLAARKGLLQAFEVSGAAPRPLWRYQMPHEVLGSPAIDADAAGPKVFLGSKFGNLIALDARTGRELWKRMAGNWIDNSACVGEVGGVRAVFAGSHDYRVWAFRASDGEVLWKRALGGEVYSAPAFFTGNGVPMLAVAALDNHLYVLDARDGRVVTSYFTGQPLWDKVAKGEVLWGSPAALLAGRQTAVVHGSFNGEVYALPLYGECELRTKVQSAATLWWGLLVTFVLFAGVVLPVVLNLKARGPARGA